VLGDAFRCRPDPFSRSDVFPFSLQQYFELRTRALQQAAAEDGLVTYPHKFDVALPDIRDYIEKFGHLEPQQSIETEIVSVAGASPSSHPGLQVHVSTIKYQDLILT
jgi:hypothetical protein